MGPGLEKIKRNMGWGEMSKEETGERVGEERPLGWGNNSQVCVKGVKDNFHPEGCQIPRRIGKGK